MRISARLFLIRWVVLGGVILYFAPGDKARAGRFSIDPDPASPTLGELLDRDKRKAPSPSAPLAKPKDMASEQMPPTPPARPFVTTPHMPRNATTVVLPRPPVRKIDLGQPIGQQVIKAPSEVTHSISRVAPAPATLADIREHSLILGSLPYNELIRVLKAADFDAVRYPLRKTDKDDVIIVIAPAARVQRLEALIGVLNASRDDTAVIAPDVISKRSN